jgi:hypothetical protein
METNRGGITNVEFWEAKSATAITARKTPLFTRRPPALGTAVAISPSCYNI